MPVVVKVDWNQMDYFAVKKVLGDMLPVFTAIGAEVMKEIDRNFQAEGVWSKWAPMRPNTKAGRRQGASSKLLQGSGRLRASFRMEPLATQVRVGSPSILAAYHHEGRKGPWTIAPKRAKALAFPVAQGGQSLKGMGQSRGVSVGMVRGNLIHAAHKAGPGARIKVVRFGSYGYQKRSASFMAGVPMAVVMKVRHPGYPARPLLPPPWRATELAVSVAQAMIDRAKG